VVRKKEAGPIESPAQVSIDEQSFEQGDALMSEIQAFVHAVRSGTTPVVTGEDGLRALATAMRITELVNAG
jgi:predicted dehydrogenase